LLLYSYCTSFFYVYTLTYPTAFWHNKHNNTWRTACKQSSGWNSWLSNTHWSIFEVSSNKVCKWKKS